MDLQTAPVPVLVHVRVCVRVECVLVVYTVLVPWHGPDVHRRREGAYDTLEDERAGTAGVVRVGGDRRRTLRIARFATRGLEVQEEARDEDGREPAEKSREVSGS